ncbi:helix-turn-helix transcriptional regulator [Rhodovibrionaceae bacterium A322]
MEYLEHYKRMADGVAALMHPRAEVVVHDIKAQRIAYLVNGFSNREIGSPSAIEEVEFAQGERVVGPYRKLNWDGKVLKSVTIVMPNAAGDPEALICINLDLSEMDRLHQVLGLMLDAPAENKRSEFLFRDDWYERINHIIQAWLHERDLTLQALTRLDRRDLVVALNDRGAFEGQGAVEYVARCLGLGRATIYKYLKEARS